MDPYPSGSDLITVSFQISPVLASASSSGSGNDRRSIRLADWARLVGPPFVGELPLHDAVHAHAPASFPTARSQIDVAWISFQLQQHAPSLPGAFPLFPVTLPHVPAYPLVQLQHLAPCAADSKGRKECQALGVGVIRVF